MQSNTWTDAVLHVGRLWQWDTRKCPEQLCLFVILGWEIDNVDCDDTIMAQTLHTVQSMLRQYYIWQLPSTKRCKDNSPSQITVTQHSNSPVHHSKLCLINSEIEKRWEFIHEMSRHLGSFTVAFPSSVLWYREHPQYLNKYQCNRSPTVTFHMNVLYHSFLSSCIFLNLLWEKSHTVYYGQISRFF